MQESYLFRIILENRMKIIITGQILFFWITNYQGFWNNQLNLHEFLLRGM
jgi:hypothetical protein